MPMQDDAGDVELRMNLEEKHTKKNSRTIKFGRYKQNIIVGLQ